MAKGFKTGGKNWQKGVSPNPAGRPALLPAVKALRALNHETISALIRDMQGLSKEEIESIAKDPKSPMLNACFASVMLSCWKYGDMGNLDKLLDRGAGATKRVVLVEKQEVGSFQFIEGETEQNETND